MGKKIIYLDDAIGALKTCQRHCIDPDDYYISAEDAEYRINALPSAQPEILACGEGELITQLGIIRCEDCMHNGSFDTDCPIHWKGKEYCSFAERLTDG